MYDPGYKRLLNYRVGRVFEPIHNFSLVNQEIHVNSNSFHVKFPNIWKSYKLLKVTDKSVYDSWLSTQMQFWQNQLNFAVWCATTGCGLSKQHLNHANPKIKSFFPFHAYYQIRRILSETSCPLPTEESFNPLNNGIDKNAFERICNEFGISTHGSFRQKLDPMNGMGYVWYTKVTTQAHGAYRSYYITSKKVKTKTDSFDSKFQVEGDPMDYLEQTFHKESGHADNSPDGTPMAAIGRFITDYSDGFTRVGISRINDSIRVHSWAILGAQAQSRSSILGSGKAFDAQKQFLANVKDAINSAVDLPSWIDRYQRTLQYAKSKLDFVVGYGLYMLPSDMDLHVGTLNGYNNLIQIATDDMELGYNAKVNDEPSANSHPLNMSTTTTENDLDFEDSTSNFLPYDETELTHDETELTLTGRKSPVGIS